METFALLATVVAIGAMGVGSFLVHDGYKHHVFAGQVAEGIGLVALGANYFLRSQVIEQQAYDCSFRNSCDAMPDNLLEFFATAFAFSHGASSVRGFIAEAFLLGAAYLAGWAVALLTKRRPAPANQ
ncbi:hypothetical protein [Kribbella sp. NPDC023855]|uniref:hypothetical protein n=1 Tax=Kribbella sp. NPDC023855 TaxID=3154698 RepID=UPI0033C50B40